MYSLFIDHSDLFWGLLLLRDCLSFPCLHLVASSFCWCRPLSKALHLKLILKQINGTKSHAMPSSPRPSGWLAKT